jgi:hypothetical protein
VVTAVLVAVVAHKETSRVVLVMPVPIRLLRATEAATVLQVDGRSIGVAVAAVVLALTEGKPTTSLTVALEKRPH